MSDLIERLQSHMGKADMGDVLRDCRLAADRIEALEAALRYVAAEAQQPTAWRIYKSKGDGVCWQEITASHTVAKRKKAEGYFVDPLYLGVAQADRIEALEAALRVFADPLSWRRDGSCDPNSGRFEGQSIARAALAEGHDK